VQQHNEAVQNIESHSGYDEEITLVTIPMRLTA
jgi:hypothetical protein